MFNENIEEEYYHIQYYNKLRILELLSAIISFLSIVISCVYYEFHFSYPDKSEFKALLIVSTILTIILMINIVFTEFTYLEYLKRLKLLTLADNVFNSKYVTKIIFMIIAFVIHPNIFLYSSQFAAYNNTYSIDISRDVNTILCIIQFSRFYFIFRYILFNSFFNTPYSKRLCRSNFFDDNYLFIIKAFAKYNPFWLYLISIVLFVYAYSFSVRAFERELSDFSGQDFHSFFNCLWYILITMTTVGFGDFAAYTTEGRFFAMLACITGIFLLSMMVITLSNMLDMSPTEERIYDIMQTCKINEKIKNSSKKIVVDFMTKAFLYKKKKELNTKVGINKDYIKKLNSQTVYDIQNEMEKIKRKKFIRQDNITDNLKSNRMNSKDEVNNGNRSYYFDDKTQSYKLKTFSYTNAKDDCYIDKVKYEKAISVRESIEKETYEYKILNDKIKAMKESVSEKVNQEKLTNFTRHLESIGLLLQSYGRIEENQDKLQVEIFEIKKRLEKIFNFINS